MPYETKMKICADCPFCEHTTADLGYCISEQVYVTLDAPICADMEAYYDQKEPQEETEEEEEMEEEEFEDYQEATGLCSHRRHWLS